MILLYGNVEVSVVVILMFVVVVVVVEFIIALRSSTGLWRMPSRPESDVCRGTGVENGIVAGW